MIFQRKKTTGKERAAKVPDEAVAALEESRERLAAAKSRNPVIVGLGAAMRGQRQANHFAALILDTTERGT